MRTQKRLWMLALLLAVMLTLSSCVIFLPQRRESDAPKEFSKEGISITLTEAFTERVSEMGFDAYYTSRDCGVMVLKEAFTLEEGLAERAPEQYIRNVIRNNGHEVEPQERDGLLYYTKDTTVAGDAARYYSFVYKGSDAFWIVQFGCRAAKLPEIEERVMDWAKKVKVE